MKHFDKNGDMIQVPRKQLAQWESWARVRGNEVSPESERSSILSDGLADEMKAALNEPRATVSATLPAKALTLLQQAADGLYNGFEPDNQSALWLRINAYLKSGEYVGVSCDRIFLRLR